MRVYTEKTHWKILLEEGDKDVLALTPPPEIRTLEFGYLRNEVGHWDGPIQKVQKVPQVSLTLDPELVNYARERNFVDHPLDIHSIIETDSEPDYDVVESETEDRLERATSRPNKLGLHRRKKDGHNVWRVSGTGEYNWANNAKVDLNGLSPRSLAKQSLALQSLRKQWNKGKELKPRVPNMTIYAKYQKGDPDCKFSFYPNF